MNESKLIKAVIGDSYEAIQELITKFGINAQDRDQRTILMNCVIKNKLHFVINLLLNKDLDLNHQDYQGYTALHIAVENNLLEILILLLNDKRIKVDIQDNWGNTPLWRAVHNNPDNREIIDALIDKGANIRIENNHGVSPLQIMQEDQEDGAYNYSSIIE